MHIELVDEKRNRVYGGEVVVDDLTVFFKKRLTKRKLEYYDQDVPGTDHSMVREYDRTRRRVRFWTCEYDEFPDGISLAFRWERYAGTSSGISVYHADTERIIRRGMRLRHEPNATCESCEQESDWYVGFRTRADATYDGSYGFMREGVFYRTGGAFCNRHLAAARKQGEQFDVFRPDPVPKSILRRLGQSPQADAASAMVVRHRRGVSEALSGFQTEIHSFWKNQRRNVRRKREKLEASCARLKIIPSEVQYALDQLRRWEQEAERNIASRDLYLDRLRARY